MVLVSLSLWATVGAPAPAQDAQGEIESKLDELDRVQSSQGPLREQIDQMNAEVDQLIGQESELRQQEAAVEEELAAKEAELDQATAELNAQKARLAQLRAKLQKATAALELLLVEIYKSNEPDIASVIVRSSDWGDLLTRTEYYERIQDYDEQVVESVRGLRDEVASLVEQLAETHARIKAARDEVLAKERQLASARTQIQQRHAELNAARRERQGVLEQLLEKEEALEEDLYNIPAPAGRAALVNGEAIPPPNAPLVVRAVIDAANAINDKPYVWGGGHGSFESSGYDCSGAVSYALHGGGLLDSPMDSTGFTAYGAPGGGSWITTYAYSGHMYAVIAGLRFDTSDTGGSGPRWHESMRSPSGFIARHPPGM
ncbi:MAG: coiled-coil domain-containing protein [Solirubrobacterales bacterium]